MTSVTDEAIKHPQEESRSGGAAADRNATEPRTARGFPVSTSRTNKGRLSTCLLLSKRQRCSFSLPVGPPLSASLTQAALRLRPNCSSSVGQERYSRVI